MLWTISDDRGTVKAGTVPLRDTPVCASCNATGRRSIRAASRFRSRVSASAYRVTLDVRTYGHAGIDVVVAPARAYLPPGGRARGGSRCNSTRCARSAIGASATSAISTHLSDRGRRRRRRWSASTRCTPRTAAIPGRRAPTRRRRRRFLNWLAIDVAGGARSRRPRRAALHRVGQRRLDRAARRKRSSTTRASRWSKHRRLEAAASPRLSGARAEAFARTSPRAATRCNGSRSHEALVARYGRNRAMLACRRCARAEPRRSGGVRARRAARDRLLDVPAVVRERATRACGGGRRERRRRAYRDLAVGVESRRRRRVGRTRLRRRRPALGAPPDPLNTHGQDWGLPPLSPAHARARRVRDLCRLARRQHARRAERCASTTRCRCCALFWIPHGRPAGRRRVRPLSVRRTARDRSRARASREAAWSIGEDLGTVPAGFRDKMAASNILS